MRRNTPGKVDKLPPEVRELIAALRQTHGWTIDQILDALRALAAGQPPRLPGSLPPELTALPLIDPDKLPGRSGLGLHIQGLDRLAARLHKTRAIAEALVRKTGSEESRLTQLNVELMHSVVTDLVLAAESAESGQANPDEDAAPGVLSDPAQVMFLAKALDHLASARKKDADMVLKARQEARVETVKVAEAAVRGAGLERGLSDRLATEIRARIFGAGA